MGTAFNPVQRRLTEAEVDDLVARYVAGSAIGSAAVPFAVAYRTV
jgi:hypothetical protein